MNKTYWILLFLCVIFVICLIVGISMYQKTNANSEEIPETIDKRQVIIGEEIILELPDKAFVIDLYRFIDPETNVTCYTTLGGTSINSITCINQN